MSTISIEDAQAKLAELIRNMSPGKKLIITADDQKTQTPILTLRLRDFARSPPPVLAQRRKAIP